jgi:hypothetical protein
MIKFKIEQTEYQLPEFISIENYSKIYKIKDLFSEDYFAAKLINIVAGAPLNDLLQSDYQQVNYMATYLMNLFPLDKPKFYDRFEIDGVKYGFFPNWRDLTFAEFVDLDTISTKKPDELLDLLHILASIMYRPIVSEKSEHDYQIEKYDINKMKERAELFKKKLDVKYVLGAQFFFIKFAKRFSGYTQMSSIPTLSIWTKIKLVWYMRKMIWRMIFKKPSDGSWSSTELVEMILRNTNTSIKKM